MHAGIPFPKPHPGPTEAFDPKKVCFFEDIQPACSLQRVRIPSNRFLAGWWFLQWKATPLPPQEISQRFDGSNADRMTLLCKSFSGILHIVDKLILFIGNMRLIQATIRCPFTISIEHLHCQQIQYYLKYQHAVKARGWEISAILISACYLLHLKAILTLPPEHVVYFPIISNNWNSFYNSQIDFTYAHMCLYFKTFTLGLLIVILPNCSWSVVIIAKKPSLLLMFSLPYWTCSMSRTSAT